MKDTAALLRQLAESAGRVRFSDLRAHLQRGGVFVVAPPLTLLDVGVAVATDATEAVAGWIGSEALRRPTASEVAEWETTADDRFEVLVVQPFVLVRPVAPAD